MQEGSKCTMVKEGGIMRITRKVLQECTEFVSDVTDIPIFITYSNGYHKIEEYCKDGHSTITIFYGSTRDCYNYLVGMLHMFHNIHDYPI